MIYSHKRMLLTQARLNSLPRYLPLRHSGITSLLSALHLFSHHQVGKRRKYNQGGLWRHLRGHCGPLLLLGARVLRGHQPSGQHQRQPQRGRLL